MDTQKKFFELTKKALAVHTKVSFMMGGAILLIYCGRYGGFPDGLTRRYVTHFPDGHGFFCRHAGDLLFSDVPRCGGVVPAVQVVPAGSNIPRIFQLETLMREARRRKTVLRYVHSEFSRNYKRRQPLLYHYRFPSFTPIFYLMSVLIVLEILTLARKDYVLWYIKLICAALYLGAWYILLDLTPQRGAQMDLIFRDQQTLVKLRSQIRLVNTLGTAFIFFSVIFPSDDTVIYYS